MRLEHGHISSINMDPVRGMAEMFSMHPDEHVTWLVECCKFSELDQILINLHHNWAVGLPKRAPIKLWKTYASAIHFTGSISTSLVAYQILRNNNISGSIPSNIGDYQRLLQLRFQGNSFGGSIPTTFSNLTLMEDLRISDLSNGSSSLAFLKDMKSLNLLILRNNNISGSIPSNIGDYQRLLQLNNKKEGNCMGQPVSMHSLEHGD
ncbi:unnamed protein product [Camellia sinensis]